MGEREEAEPIALRAYEILAERYAARADSKAENAYVERPAMLSLSSTMSRSMSSCARWCSTISAIGKVSLRNSFESSALRAC
jgi:hypothetical protein